MPSIEVIYFKVRAAAIIICSFSACLGVAAKEGPSLSGFVPVLKLKPTGAVEAGYLSPDGLRSLVVGRGGYGLTAFINPVKPAEPALSYQNEPFYTMTGAVWLPKHGHIFVESK